MKDAENIIARNRCNGLQGTFEQFGHGGYKQLKSGDLGGCNGVPENAWEEHRWTTWSIEDK